MPPYMEGLIYAYPVNSGNAEFQRLYKAHYGQDSQGASDANAYDATRILIEALRAHSATGVDVNSAVRKISLEGASVQNISFDENHQISNASFEIKTVANGVFTSAH